LGGASAGFAGATPKEAMMSRTQTVAKLPLNAEQATAPTAHGRASKRAHATRLKSEAGTSKRDFRSEPSKADQILKLLRRKRGASIGDIQELTHWQAHSVRGFLSATVKTRLGLSLRSERSEKGERRYLIVAA
jgi:hypothetical protein